MRLYAEHGQPVIEATSRTIATVAGMFRADWPTSAEVAELISTSVTAEMFDKRYKNVFAGDERWQTELGLPECDTARQVVERLFVLDVQPLAAARHAEALVGWLQGQEREIAARVEGKFSSEASSS